MLLGIVMRRIWKLQSCEKVGRVALCTILELRDQDIGAFYVAQEHRPKLQNCERVGRVIPDLL